MTLLLTNWHPKCFGTIGVVNSYEGGGGANLPGDNFNGENFVSGKFRHTSNFGAGP